MVYILFSLVYISKLDFDFTNFWGTYVLNNDHIHSFLSHYFSFNRDLNDAAPEDVDSYRIYYSHQNFNDVKTIHEEETQHILKGLEPFTQYEIKVVSIINGTESPESQLISAFTDVDAPSAPIITNASCSGTGMVYVEWTKPLR